MLRGHTAEQEDAAAADERIVVFERVQRRRPDELGVGENFLKGLQAGGTQLGVFVVRQFEDAGVADWAAMPMRPSAASTS